MKKPSPRVRRALVAGIAVIAAFGLLGAFVLPHLARSALEEQLAGLLKRQVSIGTIEVNPYALSATVRELRVREPGGAELAGFDALHANLELWSLLRGGFVLRELRLDAPRVALVRTGEGRYNVSDIVEALLARPAGEPTRFSVANIQIAGGRIDFDDQPRGRRHQVSEIAIGLPFVSNLPVDADVFIVPAFSAKLNGTPVALGGQARPFAATREASLTLDLADLDLARYFDYAPLPLAVRLPSARLDTQLKLRFVQPPGGSASVSLAGDASLRQVKLLARDGSPLLELPRLDVKLQRIEPLAGRYEIAAVSAQAPALDVLRGSDGRLQLLALLPPAAPGGAPAASPAKPPQWKLDLVRIADGRVRLRDEAVRPAFSAEAKSIELEIKGLSGTPGAQAQIALSLAGSAGETLAHEGTLGLSPLAAVGQLRAGGITPASYAPYFAHLWRGAVERGEVDAAARYRYADGNLVVSEASAAVRDLRVSEPGARAPALQVARIELKDGGLDLAKRQAGAGELSVSDPRARLSRLPDGSLSLARLLPAASAAKPAPARKQDAAKPPPAGEWDVNLARLAVSGGTVDFEDRTLAEPVRLQARALRLSAENLGTRRDIPARFTFNGALGRRGTLAASGTLRPDPLLAQIRFDAKAIDLVPLQPYFTEALEVSLTRGQAGARGQVQLAAQRGGEIRVSYRGDADLADLHSVDKANAADLLAWKSLSFRGIEVSHPHTRLHMGEVALTDFFARVIIDPSGRLNLQQLRRVPAGPPAGEAGAPAQPRAVAAAAPAGARAEARPKISIGRISLQGGNVNFSDRFIKPNYSANLTDIAGSVGSLSSEPGTTADVDLRGRVDHTAPLSISGRVNPLADDLFLDLKASVKDVELPPLTPYAGKYAGYAIEKGKLSMDVAYQIDKRQLTAQNALFLDQLTFGERVDSPDATKLPVLLAVALLKNSRGEIDIRLPIGGSLDDPQFSMAGIIVKVIVNLIAKAVSAPFALLGSLFGGGEELAWVDFDPGRHRLSAESEKKLGTLARALADRPGLKLEIAGAAVAALDTEALKRVALERKVKAQKLAELVGKGESAPPVEQIALTPEEYSRYLGRAYKAEKFPKPRNLIGLAKDLPPDEMEKLILAHTSVGEEDLRELANRRAQAAKDHLLGKGGVAAERVFIVAPQLGAADKAGSAAARANFSLK